MVKDQHITITPTGKFSLQMKRVIIIFIFLFSINVAAQPGDYGYSERVFTELTDALKKDPNNYELIWERIEVSRFDNTYFDMYSKSGDLKSQLSYFKDPAEIFNDLNKLIDNNAVIGKHNIAEFKMLRGRLYYFSGEKGKALNDYLSALYLNDSLGNNNLQDDIYISMAAYYYNVNDSLTEENAKQALKYVSMINPHTCHSNQTQDCLEREKKELLRFLKERKKLLAYYKELIFLEHNNYIKSKNDRPGTTDYIYNTNEFYFKTLTRINELAEYYDEIGDHQKSKNITAQLLRFLPPGSNGENYTMFPKKKIYGIAAKEYNKRFFKLHQNKHYDSTWDYQDITNFVGSLKKYD